MKYNGFYFWMFKSPMKKVLAEKYGKAYASQIMKKSKKLYRELVEKADDIGDDNPMAYNELFALAFVAPYVASEKEIPPTTVQEMMRRSLYVRTFENRFAEELQNRSLDEQKKEQARKKRELEKAEKRIAELDLLFRRLYEDNVSGKISDKRFRTLSAGYEAEQSEKKTDVEAMKAELAASDEQTEGIGKFIRMVKSVTEPNVLTPELVHRFVSRIVVHEARKIDGVRHQDIDIYYSGVGIIYPSDPEEMERLFQEHLKSGRNRTRVYAGDTADRTSG